ncbi:MAG TPA: HEAT repeat domain-containing protein [Bacteroidota bacterium]
MRPTIIRSTIVLTAAAVLLPLGFSTGGAQLKSGTSPAIAASAAAFTVGIWGDGGPALADEQDKPDQQMYKDGYNLILEEQWFPARKKFAELLQKYPSTGYADDAKYWSAYALMHTDLKKALAAYKEFVAKHPKSSYYSDAVADMANVQAQIEAQRATLQSLRNSLDTLRFAIPTPAPGALAVPDMREFKVNMRHLRWNMRGMGRNLGHLWVPGFRGHVSEDSLDEATRLKLDALAALGEGKEDEKGFQTLKEVALDRQAPLALRLEALDQLQEFTKFDAAGVYVEAAKGDTSEQVQSAAIEFLRRSVKDRNKAVESLSSLFGALPRSRADQRAMIVYEIADVGNDRAVDFLSNVARNDKDYELRSDAVYYLGNIGGDKARAALYEILKSK